MEDDIKKNKSGLCFRCEHRAIYLEEGHSPRFECQMIENSVSGCYMFNPTKPICIKPISGEKRPISLDIFSGRVERVEKEINLNLSATLIDKDLLIYWNNLIDNNVKMFLFARWISTCYADIHLDSKMKSEHDEGFNPGEAISVLNRENGEWWKTRLEYFNSQVYPNYVKNNTVKNTKKFLIKKRRKNGKGL